MEQQTRDQTVNTFKEVKQEMNNDIQMANLLKMFEPELVDMDTKKHVVKMAQSSFNNIEE